MKGGISFVKLNRKFIEASNQHLAVENPYNGAKRTDLFKYKFGSNIGSKPVAEGAKNTYNLMKVRHGYDYAPLSGAVVSIISGSNDGLSLGAGNVYNTFPAVIVAGSFPGQTIEFYVDELYVYIDYVYQNTDISAFSIVGNYMAETGFEFWVKYYTWATNGLKQSPHVDT